MAMQALQFHQGLQQLGLQPKAIVHIYSPVIRACGKCGVREGPAVLSWVAKVQYSGRNSSPMRSPARLLSGNLCVRQCGMSERALQVFDETQQQVLLPCITVLAALR